MAHRKDSDEEFLETLRAHVAEDVLKSDYSLADVDAELRAAGGDPEEIGNRGAALVRGLLERRRLAWQENARAKRAKMERAVGSVSLQPMSVAAMIAQINAARSDP